MVDHKWNDLQLSFDLDLDEVADDAQDRSISQEEARQISEAARQRFINSADEKNYAEWFQDYLGLIEKGWPWRIACYIAWASSPKNERWPKTLQQLAADVLGLTGPRVIYTWRKRHPTIDTVIAMMQAAPLWEHRRDVIEALVEMARTPDYKAFNDRKLFLEMIGDYVPKSKLDLRRSGKADELSELSDEELDTLIGERQNATIETTEEETDGDAGAGDA